MRGVRPGPHGKPHVRADMHRHHGAHRGSTADVQPSPGQLRPPLHRLPQEDRPAAGERAGGSGTAPKAGTGCLSSGGLGAGALAHTSRLRHGLCKGRDAVQKGAELCILAWCARWQPAGRAWHPACFPRCPPRAASCPPHARIQPLGHPYLPLHTLSICLPLRVVQTNGQGGDIGSQYRTGVYWHNEEQKRVRGFPGVGAVWLGETPAWGAQGGQW